MNQINLPHDPKVAIKVVQAQADAEQERLRRGLLGGLFGARERVPNHVAGMVVFGSMLAILVLAFSSGAGAEKTITTLGGLLTTALGFLFGRASKE